MITITEKYQNMTLIDNLQIGLDLLEKEIGRMLKMLQLLKTNNLKKMLKEKKIA